MFKNVIVRKPSRNIVNGITSTPELGKPDYDLAMRQHEAYIEALEKCGVTVTILEAIEAYPDSCFVEDVKNLTLDEVDRWVAKNEAKFGSIRTVGMTIFVTN